MPPNHPEPENKQAIPKRRKLALVKCDRCRLDKQKCLPVDRQWPAKCNRCIEKDFPCSEGKRVERKTKHNATSIRPTASNISGGSSATDTFTIRITQWSTLLSFHKMMGMALKQLDALKREFLENFFDDSSGEFEFSEAIDDDNHYDLKIFYADLERTVSELTAELLGSTVQSTHPDSVIISELIGQTMPIFSWQALCPICFDAGDGATLQALRQTGNVCGEYLARLSRVVRHMNGVYHGDSDSSDRLNMELHLICALSFEVDSMVTVALKELHLFDNLPSCSQTSLIFRPSEVNYKLWSIQRVERDCLGRTGLHQLLDALQKPDAEASRYLRQTHTQNYINEQDILGRTALHIACLKGWQHGVSELLQNNADPSLTSAYGTLPLHHAAANGSIGICKLLLDICYGNFGYDVNQLDLEGKSALYYAVGSKNINLVEHLLGASYGFELNYGTEGESLPLYKAIEMKSEELVQILLRHGADSDLVTDLDTRR